MNIKILFGILILLPTVLEAGWVRLQKNTVVEIFENQPTLHPSVMTSITNAPDNVTFDWRLIDNNWLPPLTDVEKEALEFEKFRQHFLKVSPSQARKTMINSFKYKLDGNLLTGLPDTTKPLCVTDDNQILTLEDFMDYIQERDDAGASQSDIVRYKKIAKDARLYIKSLK